MSGKISSSNPLRKELETYRNKTMELEQDLGKFVLIKGDKVKGIYPSKEEALRNGYEKIGFDKPFLVKQIMRPGTEPVATFSRSIFTA